MPEAAPAAVPRYPPAMLFYLHGFASGPSSKKAQLLRDRFAAVGIPMQIPDLTPGEDGFERSSPSSMRAAAEAALAAAGPGPHGIVGSSLGGYLAAVLSSEQPSVARMVLLAPAVRLFERWSARLGPAEIEAWRRDGLLVDHFASGTQRRLGAQFLEDARGWPAFPPVTTPTLCIAGTRDETVPFEDVEAFVARTPSARLVPVDDVHELTASIDRIFDEARAFLAPVTAMR